MQEIARRSGRGKYFQFNSPREIFNELRIASKGGNADYYGITYEKIEANLPIDDSRFHIPPQVTKSEPGAKAADASEKLPQKREDEKKPPTKPPTKP